MGKKISDWCYRWLPIIMGCHCRPDRSFHYHGRPFPVCARCTGMLAGFLIAGAGFAFWHPGLLWLVVLTLPGTIDGAVQMKTAYESRNRRRLWTGILMGYGTMTMLIWSQVAAYQLGNRLGMKLFH